jgi:hypothetical protein
MIIFSYLKVASFGGFLLKENIMTLSFAPRDSHESQIQFALERNSRISFVVGYMSSPISGTVL